MDFSDHEWKYLISKIKRTFRLNAGEVFTLKKNCIAKLIASIPYFADCDEPRRTALSHLSWYMMTKNPACKKDFEHTPMDNAEPLRRLSFLTFFGSGKKSIIQRGITLLALIQLEDHQQDKALDDKKKKYNPILSGSWDYYAEKKRLLAQVSNIPCPAMDRIIHPSHIPGFWDNGSHAK